MENLELEENVDCLEQREVMDLLVQTDIQDQRETKDLVE